MSPSTRAPSCSDPRFWPARAVLPGLRDRCFQPCRRKARFGRLRRLLSHRNEPCCCSCRACGWVAESGPVIVDAISGVTGAGKSCNARTHFCSADENLEAYGVGKHRHTPEIEQILGLTDRIVFTPHLAPLKRGLLSTVTLPARAAGTRHVDP